MKESKQEKASEGEDGVDIISKLPDPILQSILSHIPSTEELIRTSILSTRWRNLWTLIPSIDIDFTRKVDSSINLESNGFKEFVFWVLLNKPLHLDSFRLWCAGYYDMTTVNWWIHAAVMRKVKLLDLMFCPYDESEDVELPHCLVTCGSLEVFRLCLLKFYLNVPKITGFQALRVLELSDVLLKEAEVIKYFIESCPLLEDLSLLHCDADDLIISSPKLKYLRIENLEKVSHVDTNEFLNCKMTENLEMSCPNLVFLSLKGSLAYDFLFENLYSLKKAVIHIKHFFDTKEPKFDVFDEMSHVESLSISLYCVGQCFNPRVDEPISLPNLKTLELTVDKLSLHLLIPFLKCLPDLESLHLIFIKFDYGLEDWNLDGDEKVSFLTWHLKKVEFLEFDKENPKLDLARAFLEHGNELEEMVFSWNSDEVEFRERAMKTINQVSRFYKASSSVKIRGVINPSQ